MGSKDIQLSWYEMILGILSAYIMFHQTIRSSLSGGITTCGSFRAKVMKLMQEDSTMATFWNSLYRASFRSTIVWWSRRSSPDRGTLSCWRKSSPGPTTTKLVCE